MHAHIDRSGLHSQSLGAGHKWLTPQRDPHTRRAVFPIDFSGSPHAVWLCGRCEEQFVAPKHTTPPGWDVFENPASGKTEVTCPACLEHLEQAHIVRTAKPLPVGEAEPARQEPRDEDTDVKPAVPRAPAIMMTSLGLKLDLLDPQPELINILDIAHQLSHICRFAGAVRDFYSVAEHSVWVSRRLPPDLALQGLLHDASEAYLGDITSPLKAQLPDYRAIEARMSAVINRRYALPEKLDPLVKAADVDMAIAEAAALMPQDRRYWGPAKPDPLQHIECWTPREAERRFLDRFAEIADTALLTRGLGDVLC